MKILLGLILFLPCSLLAQVRPPCTDLSLPRCRVEFTMANLPRPNTINPNSPLLDPITKALADAVIVEKYEKVIRDDIEYIEKVLSGNISIDDTRLPPTIENLLSNGRLLADTRKEKYALRNKAITLTRDIYGLTPGVVVAPAHDPDMPGSVEIRPWNPIYSENQELDESGHGRLLSEKEKLELARKAGLPPGSKIDHDAGTSRDDARIVMFPHAFERPEMLAAMIMHETVHWLDRAARGTISLPFDSFTSEEKAYTLVANEATAFGLTPDDVASMKNMAVIYAKQAKLSPGLTWGQVETHHKDWLFSSSPSTDDDNPSPGRPEPTKEQADISFLDSWRQATGAVIESKARVEEQARLDKERLEREREEQEREYRERKQRDFQEEMDGNAASCGYTIRYDADKAILGFGHFRLGRDRVPFDLGDLKVVFLITRACNEIQSHPHQPAPPACNRAADYLLRERILRGGFMPKIEYLAATWLWDGAWVKGDRCIQLILNNADRITDTKSFNVLMASFQKSESKRLKEEARRADKRSRREEKEERGGGSRPPVGNDPERIWDPGCQCWTVRR